MSQSTTVQLQAYEDFLDICDEQTVAYMASRRHIDEAAMRKLLTTDKEVHASYQRKIARLIAAAKLKGLTHEQVLKGMLRHRQRNWTYSPDAGPQLPPAKDQGDEAAAA
jgi:hypothetical protein